MKKANCDIRLAKGKIPNWVLAQAVGVHEITFIRWMRTELDPETKEIIFNAITKIKEAGGNE
ncbi:hypothetical protein [Peribacillus sp. SCS-155]|uniref:hypothetical protein n=1 Tax=Peribacillus sedimenti TaxID=3115297 RepID=UPI003905A3FB